MRILLATGLYPPDIGGPATYAKLLEERLPRHGIEVTVLPFGPVRRLPPIIRHLIYAWKVAAASRGADIILVQDSVSTGLPVAIASFCMRKKFIVRVPGDYAWEQGVQRFGVKESLDEFQKRSYARRVEMLRNIQRFTVARAHRIIAPSRYLANIISQWLPRPVPIDVIYNGVETGEIPHIPRERNLIVTSGRLVLWKGFLELIEVTARHRDWRLAIIGSGPEERILERKAASLGATDHVIFTGQLPRTDTQKWFARATVFVLNSTYEGFSHTLIEAMAAGAPIIATRVGGNPETIRGSLDGILIDAGDTAGLERCIAELLSDEVLRTKLGDAARERAKEFSIDRTIEATASLLKSCVPLEVLGRKI